MSKYINVNALGIAGGRCTQARYESRAIAAKTGVAARTMIRAMLLK